MLLELLVGSATTGNTAGPPQVLHRPRNRDGRACKVHSAGLAHDIFARLELAIDNVTACPCQ